MTTKEIVQKLQQNEMLRQMIPDWAHRTIPYPFRRDGYKYLGFYFYPQKTVDNRQQILPPIMQMIVGYPMGLLVNICTASYCLSSKIDPGRPLGEYPSASMKCLSYVESNELYDQYYAACDRYLEKNDKACWEKAFEKVKEEGFDQFFAQFADSETVPVVENKLSAPVEESTSAFEGEKTAVLPFSDQTRSLIRQMKKYLSDPVFRREKVEMQKVLEDSRRDGYSVAVIGEFSRGKSTFLNKLLDLDCLPAFIVPTTAVLTRIGDGATPAAAFIDKKRVVRKFPLTMENLERFKADAKGNDPEGILSITAPLRWLNKKRVVFFDTPGVGDCVSRRADIARSTIRRCDCSVMVISAQMPVSETELEFLKENVVLKAVPNSVILISYLDTIPGKERNQSISHIKDKISAILPKAKFWIADSLPDINASLVDACGIEAIRRQILTMCESDREAANLREIQVRCNLQQILESSAREIQLQEDVEKLSAEKQADVIRELEAHRRKLDFSGDELSVTCEEMRQKAQEKIVADLIYFMENFKKDLHYALDKTTSPKDWCEQDLPHQIDKFRQMLIPQIENRVLKVTGDDRIQLVRQIKEKFSSTEVQILLPGIDTSFKTDAALVAPEEDINAIRKYCRIGSMAAAALAFTLLGGLGAVAVGGVSLLTETITSNTLKKQKESLHSEIDKMMGDMSRDLEMPLVNHLKECYEKMASTVKDETENALKHAIAKINDAQNKQSQNHSKSRDLRANLEKLLADIKK